MSKELREAERLCVGTPTPAEVEAGTVGKRARERARKLPKWAQDGWKRWDNPPDNPELEKAQSRRNWKGKMEGPI